MSEKQIAFFASIDIVLVQSRTGKKHVIKNQEKTICGQPLKNMVEDVKASVPTCKTCLSTLIRYKLLDMFMRKFNELRIAEKIISQMNENFNLDTFLNTYFYDELIEEIYLKSRL